MPEILRLLCIGISILALLTVLGVAIGLVIVMLCDKDGGNDSTD